MKAVRQTQAPAWILLLTVLIIAVYGFFAMDRFWRQSGTEQTAAVKEAILRAAAHAYALEGSYPPDLAYLEQNYGLILDHKRYSYVYEAFASNIRPEVEVLSWDTEIEQP